MKGETRCFDMRRRSPLKADKELPGFDPGRKPARTGPMPVMGAGNYLWVNYELK
ncbi:hypothetical protein NG799_08025 [Laspinema sp. D1]|uniref:Uncharacterized protein n=1 Tax=Laspinema palackyanum D2a TaxID=2953684 RepID=A0ABT2MNG6_9CYAN|nr:hypothetical protein [Laspinema sp. D2a]